MIVNRDLNSLSVSKNLQNNQSKNVKLKYSSRMSDSFKSNNTPPSNPSFGTLYKRPLLKRISGSSLPELKKEWAVEAAVEKAKMTEKNLPKLKKTAEYLKEKAIKAGIDAKIKHPEFLEIEESLPNTIMAAKEKAIELGFKPKKGSKDANSAETLVLSKKEKEIITQAVADKFGLSGDKAKVKAINAIMDAKIAESAMKKAEKNLPKLQEKAKNLKKKTILEFQNDEIAEKKAKEKRAKKRAKYVKKIKKGFKSLGKIIKHDFKSFTNSIKITSNKPKNKDIAKDVKTPKSK